MLKGHLVKEPGEFVSIFSLTSLSRKLIAPRNGAFIVNGKIEASSLVQSSQVTSPAGESGDLGTQQDLSYHSETSEKPPHSELRFRSLNKIIVWIHSFITESHAHVRAF